MPLSSPEHPAAAGILGNAGQAREIDALRPERAELRRRPAN